MVDRISKNEIVDIFENDSNLYLTITKRNNNNYKIVLDGPRHLEEYGQIISLKDIYRLGMKLIELYTELKDQIAFKENDALYYVKMNGEIGCIGFNRNDTAVCSLILSGNAFKTKEEAQNNKNKIMLQYQKLEDEGLV